VLTGRPRSTLLWADKANFSKTESVRALDRSVSEKITTTAPKYGRFSGLETLRKQNLPDFGSELVDSPADRPYF
jgi:hypothetical protein